MMKRFDIGLIWRLLLLFGCMSGLAAVFWNANFPFTQLLLAAACIGLILEIIRFVRKTNSDLAKFLFALTYKDGSVRFGPTSAGAKFPALHAELERILQHVETDTMKADQHDFVLNEIVNSLPVGVIVLKNKVVHLRNAFATQLLNAHPSDEQVANWLVELDSHARTVRYNQHEFALQRATFSSDGDFQVYTFTEVSAVSDEREMDAYLKLIRILTHEIMNSVTSISSLSATLLEVGRRQNLEAQLVEALGSIKKRSAGMLTFVDNYRKLTHVPAPAKTWFPLLPLVRELAIPFAELPFIDLQIDGDDTLQVHADRHQVSQVVLNVLLNARHAIEEQETGKIDIALTDAGHELVLTIADDGPGITPSHLNDIFTPFFSTREKGSGIGLSLSRQMMRNNNGAIGVRSEPGHGASFVLRFTR